MAVEIKKPTQYGVAANYFRIVSFSVDRPTRHVKLLVHGYTSKFAHDFNQKELVVVEYDLQGEWLDPYLNNLETSKITIAQLYQMFYERTVNMDPFFEGAVQV